MKFSLELHKFALLPRPPQRSSPPNHPLHQPVPDHGACMWTPLKGGGWSQFNDMLCITEIGGEDIVYII